MNTTARSHPVRLQPGEDAPARAAIVVLRSISDLDGDGTPATLDRVQLLPDSSVITDGEAALRLANVDKPVECRSTSTDAVLQVTCSALAPENRWLIEDMLRAREADVQSAEPSEYARFLGRRSGRVIVLGNGEYVPLEHDDFERFERSYAFLGCYDVVAGPAADFGIGEGAGDWVRWYSRSASTTTVVPR